MAGQSRGTGPCSALGRVASSRLPRRQANLWEILWWQISGRNTYLPTWARIWGASCSLWAQPIGDILSRLIGWLWRWSGRGSGRTTALGSGSLWSRRRWTQTVCWCCSPELTWQYWLCSIFQATHPRSLVYPGVHSICLTSRWQPPPTSDSRGSVATPPGRILVFLDIPVIRGSCSDGVSKHHNAMWCHNDHLSSSHKWNQSPEVLQQPLYHWSVAVGKPEELADDVPILLRQPIIVHLSLVEVSERSWYKSDKRWVGVPPGPPNPVTRVLYGCPLCGGVLTYLTVPDRIVDTSAAATYILV